MPSNQARINAVRHERQMIKLKDTISEKLEEGEALPHPTL